jgi:hypothetical protein
MFQRSGLCFASVVEASRCKQPAPMPPPFVAKEQRSKGVEQEIPAEDNESLSGSSAFSL